MCVCVCLCVRACVKARRGICCLSTKLVLLFFAKKLTWAVFVKKKNGWKQTGNPSYHPMPDAPEEEEQAEQLTSERESEQDDSDKDDSDIDS